MKHLHFHRGRRFATAALLAAACAAAPAASSAAADGHVDTSRVDVPAGNRMYFTGHATGVQIYSCSSTATGPAWLLVAPRAELFDAKGKLVATHFMGPTWEARDGSRVVGKKVDGVTVDASAVPWLLLEANAWSVGVDGDRLGNTTFIQRIATVGGLPPAADSCDADAIGATAEIGYSADYTFWRPDHV